MTCPNHPAIEEGLAACVHCGALFCPNCLVEIADRRLCLACKTAYLVALQAGTAIPNESLKSAPLNLRVGAKVVDLLLVYIVTLFIVLLSESWFGSPGNATSRSDFLASSP